MVALWGVASLGQAQTYQPVGSPMYPPYVPPPYSGGYPYGYWGSSTAAEGFARGLADVIGAMGQYNLATSAAAINLSEARRSEIAEDYLIVRQLTDELLAGLKDRVSSLPPQQYVVARRFLESLAYEASQPAG